MITALDKKTALVLIDLQNFIVNLPVVHPIKNILDNSNLLLDAFHEKNLPVVLVNVNSAGAAWTKTRKEANTSVMLPSGDDWFQITKELRVHETDIRITKHTWSAFFETALDEVLKQKQVTGIVIGGVATSIGVEGTARTASELAYNITFATDAMTDRSEEGHIHSLKNIFPRIGETGTTEEIINMLKKMD